jgi:hypothetical protein
MDKKLRNKISDAADVTLRIGNRILDTNPTEERLKTEGLELLKSSVALLMIVKELRPNGGDNHGML